MSEGENSRPGPEVDKELEGIELYREITESLQAISDADDRLYPGLDEVSRAIFVGNNEEEETTPALYLGATTHKRKGGDRSLQLDLEKLPADRSLQPCFEVSTPVVRKATEKNLSIKELNLTVEQQRIKIAIAVRVPTPDGKTIGKTIIAPEYFLNPDGTLQRNEDDKAKTARGLKMRDKEMPLVLAATLGYLKRLQETAEEQERQEQAKKKSFI